jgi:sugar lactone lactonase YvrE
VTERDQVLAVATDGTLERRPGPNPALQSSRLAADTCPVRLGGRWVVALAGLVIWAVAVPVRAGSTTNAALGSPVITTFAGGAGEGDALTLSMMPTGAALHGGLLYVVDDLYEVVRELDLANGHMRVVAGSGSYSAFAGDDGPAISATFNFGDGTHNGVTVDAAGNLYIADRMNHRVRKVDATGTITTFTGTGVSGWTGDGGLATEAQLMEPVSLASDAQGNVYIAGGAVVRKVSATGVITTVAGRATSYSDGDGGPATEAGIGQVVAVTLDKAGNLYLADAFHGLVRRVDASGIITTYAGGGTEDPGKPGIVATDAYFGWPSALAVDSTGALVVALGETRVVRVDPASRTLRVMASDLGAPRGLAVDAADNLYVADARFLQVHRVTPSGTRTKVAGDPDVWRYSGEGVPATWAQLQLAAPGGLAFDKTGNLFVSDPKNHRVRKVDRSGLITTVAGTGALGETGDGGPATEAQLKEPGPLAFDPQGNLYIHDFWTASLRRVDTSGIITTVFRDRYEGYVPGSRAMPGMAVDGVGNFYFTMGSIVRKRAPSGEYSIFAGNNTYGFSGDGGPASLASLNWPLSVAVDAAGNVYVSDIRTMRIRKIDTAGIITTVAGNGSPWFSGDGGPATEAGMYPGWMTVSPDGVLYFADAAAGHRIRRVDKSGIVTTVAGEWLQGYAGDGGPAADARVYDVAQMTTDAAGNLYFVDVGNARIRTIWFGSSPPTTTLPPRPSTTTSSTTTSTTSTSTTTTTTTTTTLPPTAAFASPYSVWTQPQTASLDGIGTWMAMVEDPLAGPSQARPSYLYALGFSFTNSPARGVIGLVTAPSGKYAVVSVAGPDGSSHDAVLPFAWAPNRFYFPLFYEVGPGAWGALVFDHAAATWIPVGLLHLPQSWGKLSPVTVTAVGWAGDAASACPAYPRTDVFVHAPTGVIGPTLAEARLTTTGATAGACAPEATVHSGSWARYQAGTARVP